ncbi:hypothetical protein AB6A40_010250 [Gnathostoma spinigerum]|uniref:Uncharacterized protein n=1 Tax=Gnathostoma spinigerum TaxID=75299 RepID=A0ABD6EUK5_9BILA
MVRLQIWTVCPTWPSLNGRAADTVESFGTSPPRGYGDLSMGTARVRDLVARQLRANLLASSLELCQSDFSEFKGKKTTEKLVSEKKQQRTNWPRTTTTS